jgi:hypothetical protein
MRGGPASLGPIDHTRKKADISISNDEVSAFLSFPAAVEPSGHHRRKKSNAVLKIILRSIQNEQLST